MNYKSSIAIILACIIGTVSAFAAEYDLDSYLMMVRKHNPDLALVQKESEAARQLVVQSRSVFFPAVGFQGGYTRNFTDIMKSTPVASLPGGGPLVYQDRDSNKDNEFTLGIGVTQKIFDPSAIARYEQSKKQQTLADNVLERTEQQILCMAKKLYAQTQLALALVGVSEGAEQTAAENFLLVQQKYSVGAAAELDLLMAEVDWKSRIPLVIEARKKAELLMNAMKTIAGMSLSEPLVLTEYSREVPALPAFPSFEAILTARPDYRAAYTAGELADISRKAASASFLPTLNGGFGYVYGGMGDGSSFNDYTYNGMQLSINVNLPIFTGGHRLSLMNSAKIAQEKSAIELMKKRRDIEAEIAGLMLRMEEARERIESELLLERASQRALDLAQAAYRGGMTTQLSVSEAASRRDQARLGVQNALYEYRAAIYDWELAAGISSNP